jgi:DNA invertase Pin-like site-specific DNA recombinase
VNKQFVGYIRVSTAKQGEHGVSLQEQHDAIDRYAKRFGLTIVQWFEERETAAKRGRPVFNEMLRLLRRGGAHGIILHKIDRGARNLKDWADLGELIDVGVEVHFANESLDLNTRGGRLSADIQAVVAADYIRNLREETRKGFYGRLKQGLYPIGAPLGYQDRGGGKPKEPDPVMGPLIAKAFQLYATGQYSFPRLLEEMHMRGLRNHSGGRVTRNGLSTILNNPFYTGVIRLKKTGEVFAGVHKPIVSRVVFDCVQRVLKGKIAERPTKHDFTFRQMVECGFCGYSLIGERQRGHVYYRCHTPTCATTGVREESIDTAIENAFLALQSTDQEMRYLENWLRKARPEQEQLHREAVENCRLKLGQIRDRLNRATDAYVDGAIDRTAFETRKASLIVEEAGVKEKLNQLEAGCDRILAQLEKILERAKTASDMYKAALPTEKRDFAKDLTSNRQVRGKNIEVMLKRTHQLIANRFVVTGGGPRRSIPRTWDRLLKQLMTLLAQSSEYDPSPAEN